MKTSLASFWIDCKTSLDVWIPLLDCFRVSVLRTKNSITITNTATTAFALSIYKRILSRVLMFVVKSTGWRLWLEFSFVHCLCCWCFVYLLAMVLLLLRVELSHVHCLCTAAEGFAGFFPERAGIAVLLSIQRQSPRSAACALRPQETSLKDTWSR